MMVGNTFYDTKINIMYKIHRKIFVQIRLHGRFCEKIFNVFFFISASNVSDIFQLAQLIGESPRLQFFVATEWIQLFFEEFSHTRYPHVKSRNRERESERVFDRERVRERQSERGRESRSWERDLIPEVFLRPIF